MVTVKIKKIKKPWGREELLINKKVLGLKKLVIKPGESTSFHRHKNKNEIFFVLKGKAKIRYKKRKEILKPNGFVFIPKNMMHQIISIGKRNLEFIEAGAPYDNKDVVRVEDPYSKVRKRNEYD